MEINIRQWDLCWMMGRRFNGIRLMHDKFMGWNEGYQKLVEGLIKQRVADSYQK